MNFLRNKHIINYLVILLCTGCAIKHSTYTLEDIEKHRTLYTQKGKRKSLTTLVDIYLDKNQPKSKTVISSKFLLNHPREIIPEEYNWTWF